MSEEYAVALGVACIDETYAADNWIPEGEKLNIRYTGSRVGGMIPNAACVLASLGMKTYLVTALNSSPTSEVIKASLEEHGLDLSYMIENDALADPKCILINTPNERSIFVVDTSAVRYPLTDELHTLFLGAKCIYTSIMEFHRIENWEKLALELRDAGVKLVIDCETSTFDDPQDPVFRSAGIVIFNEEGWKKYQGSRSKEDAMATLLNDGAEIVVVTLGAEGCYCTTKSEEVRVQGNKVEVIDPTGAGDTFNCTFVSCVLNGRSLANAAEMANAAGAYAVTVKGSQAAVGSWEEMEARMLEYRKRR